MLAIEPGVRALHESLYDRLLLYVQREVFDPVREFSMSKVEASKLVACGYLGITTPPSRSASEVRRELYAAERKIVPPTSGAATPVVPGNVIGSARDERTARYAISSASMPSADQPTSSAGLS